MLLADLDPHWLVLEEGGARVGLSFLCPHCQTTRLAVCFHHTATAAFEDSYIIAHHGANDSQHIWTLDSTDDFSSMTLHPSINASASGHWHGFITAGEIK